MTPTHQRMQALSGQHHLEGRYQPGTGARRELMELHGDAVEVDV